MVAGTGSRGFSGEHDASMMAPANMGASFEMAINEPSGLWSAGRLLAQPTPAPACRAARSADSRATGHDITAAGEHGASAHVRPGCLGFREGRL